MARGGFRVDITKARRKLAAVDSIQAEEFRPVLQKFLRASLTTASRNTPVRDYALIRRNQVIQYRNRINNIPSSHTLENPSLRIRNGVHWLFMDGRWMQANRWRLSGQAYGTYQELLQEHERRKSTPMPQFIKGRAQARYLYRKSWTQVANSLGINIPTNQKVEASISRHNPPMAPRRGYGQWRGGKNILSATISNPFLDEQSVYKNFTGATMLSPAMAQHEAQFKRNFQRAMQARLRQAMRK